MKSTNNIASLLPGEVRHMSPLAAGIALKLIHLYKEEQERAIAVPRKCGNEEAYPQCRAKGGFQHER